MKKKLKSLTAKEVLDQVNKCEMMGLRGLDELDSALDGLGKNYDLMKDYIERLHPGTRTLN